MVSSVQVLSDSDHIRSLFQSYISNLDGLYSSWKGISFDHLKNQAASFTSEFSNVITNQFNSFAQAVSLYEQYLNVIQNVAIAQSNYSQAVSYNRRQDAANFYSQVQSLTTQMNQLKTQIISYLNSINTRLDATSINGSNSVNSYIQGAMDWAIAVAANDSHGYSQSTRWGNPNYDCSSFVISAYEAAGIPVKEAGAGYTGSMRSAFTSVGFEWIPGDPNLDDLQPGDVLLTENSHTEMYLGNGKNIGAHGDYDAANGDSSGKEISITNYRSYPWQGVLRYVGNNKS